MRSAYGVRMPASPVRRLALGLVFGPLLLGGCTGGDSPGADPAEPDPSVAGSQASERHVDVLGLGFDLPGGWEQLDPEAGDADDATVVQVAEQLGVEPGRLGERLQATDLFLVSQAGVQEDFLPGIEVYPVPGKMPTEQEIRQDFVRVGAEVDDLSRETTDAGRVVVVTYQQPTSTATVEGATIVVPDDGRIVLIAVSEVDRARADAVADAVVGSLAPA